MRIKHWAGYGCLNYKVTNRNGRTMDNYGNIYKAISVRVEGLHEQGITPHWHDEYLIENWLFKRVYKGSGRMMGYNSIEISDTEAVFTMYYKED